MEIPETSVSISDYQYLNSPPPPEKPARRRPVPGRRERTERRGRRAPSLLPLVIVLGIGIAGIYGFYRLNAPRLGLDKPNSENTPLIPASSPSFEQPGTPGTAEQTPGVAA